MPLHDVIRQRLQPIGASVTSNRIMLYGLFSTCAMLGAIVNACRNQSNFYSIMIYLSRSGRSTLILANFGFIAALFMGRIMQRIFFGPLQPREVERLYDQTWMFVTESLLAFTIFRDEFDIPFVLMFGFLLFVKCFHWLMADRVESMDQMTYPGPPVLFHVRMNALFLTLSAIDFIMFTIAVESTMNNGVGGMVLFATEYAILTASALNAMARYTLTNLEYRRAGARGGDNAPPWENKSMYVFYIELVTDFLKLATYLTFFTIILTFYGLPLNIIRDVYLTARSFITRLRALIRYHNATRDMDRRYPNATEEELTAMSDRTCIICREELTAVPPVADAPAGQANGGGLPQPQPQPPQQDGPNITPKKLPCGHIFHFQCLRSWLERQQSCPTCRRTVLETDNTNRNGNQQQRQQGQQPNGAARGAAPPQPGAAPQPFQPLQPGQLPQQQQRPALGWLGRALGLAAQPPLVPGQFPNQFGGHPQQQQGQPHPQQVPPGWGYVGQHPPAPPGYYYPGYYQYAPLPPQQLHPAPVVRGFYGPGGVWHPWPVDQGRDGQRTHNQNPPPAPTPSAAQPQPHSQPPPVTGPVPTPDPLPVPLSPNAVPPTIALTPEDTSRTASSPVASSVSVSESSASSISSTDSESEVEQARTPSGLRSDPATPRDAAALAALRRLGALNPSKAPAASTSTSDSASAVSSGVELRPSLPAESTEPTVTSTSMTTTSSVTSPASNANVTETQPQPTPTTAAPTPPAASTTTTTHPPAPRAAVPTLLPLYDPARTPASQGVNYVNPPPQYAGPMYGPQAPYPGWRPATGQSRMPNPNLNYPYAPRPSPYPNNQGFQSQQHASRSASSSSRSLRPNLSTLPSTLTEEQLARLDRVTRDAIDERLRVLEGVSAAVHRCIEELTRVRSVLPPGQMGSALSGAPTGQTVPLPVATAPAPPSASTTTSVQTQASQASGADAREQDIILLGDNSALAPWPETITTAPAPVVTPSPASNPTSSPMHAPSSETSPITAESNPSPSTMSPSADMTPPNPSAGTSSGNAEASTGRKSLPPDHPMRQWGKIQWHADGMKPYPLPGENVTAGGSGSGSGSAPSSANVQERKKPERQESLDDIQ